MNPALLFVSARRELLPGAVDRLRRTHGRVLLVAPTHLEIPSPVTAQALRFPERRFSLIAGIRILHALGSRWPTVYCLSPSLNTQGMENVTAAALVTAHRVLLIAPEGEVDVDASAALRREARRFLSDALIATAIAPCWLASSIGLAATSRSTP